MSTGLTNDLESCHRDVLNFLRMPRWRIASVEVKRWTAEGLLHAVRKWETVTCDLDELAHEIAQFITGGEVETGAIVLVRPEG
ncbi:MAG: hypothetical protein WCA59_17465 [Candidatus Binataceae bacterium]